KFLLALLGGTALLGGGVHFLHASQARHTAATLLQEADRARDRGEADREEKFLQQYLAYRPDDLDVLTRYGLALSARAATRHDRELALATLDKVVRLDPDRATARRATARLAMADDLRRFDEAKSHIIFLLGSNPKDGELEGWLGRCEEADKRYAEAEAAYA